ATANSYNCTWTQWTTTKGSIIKLVMGKDVILDPGQYVGMPLSGGSTFNIQSLVYQNLSSTETITFDTIVLPIYASMIEIKKDSALRVDSIVGPGDAEAALRNVQPYHSRADIEFTGAGLMDWAKSAFGY